MAAKRGKAVRPVLPIAIGDMRFRKVKPTRFGFRLPLHPALVAADLRRGNLESLRKLLERDGSLEDREVLQELERLLSESPNASRYQLAVIPRPSSPKDRGGRPRSTALAQRNQTIRDAYKERRDSGDKKYIIVEDLAREHGISPRTVKRIVDDV